MKFWSVLTYHDRAFALRHISLLVAAGHSVAEAAQLLSRNASKRLRKQLEKVVEEGGEEAMLGPYLYSKFKHEASAEQQAVLLRGIADFIQLVGDQLDTHRKLFRKLMWPILFFFLSYLSLAPLRTLILRFLESPYVDIGMALPVPTQIELNFNLFIAEYPHYFLLFAGGIVGSFLLGLRFAWERGWLPGSSHIRSRLLAESLRTLCRLEKGQEPSLQKALSILPNIAMFKSLRSQVAAQAENLLLLDALERVRGVPAELKAGIQAGGAREEWAFALEAWCSLQARRQVAANARIEVLELCAWWLSVILLSYFYFFSFGTAVMKLLRVLTAQIF